MKKFIAFCMTILCLSAYSQDTTAANNAVKMAYNFTTVSQTVVFDNAMRVGGTLTLSAQAMDGGGRNPGDPLTFKLVFYNSSNAVITTVQQAYTLVLGGALASYSITATNCGGSCSNVAYVSVQFYGKDGGYWAGNYGPYITTPSLSFNGGGNLLYNPEFGTYTGSGTTYAQGWASSAGWQNCALYSGSATCVVDNGAQVNAAAGGYSATGGTTSGTAGGYTTAPAADSLCCGAVSTPFAASTTNVNKVNTFLARPTSDTQIYVEQVGYNNMLLIEQTGSKNSYVHYNGSGSNNNIKVEQKSSNNSQTNYADLTVNGNFNTVEIRQKNLTETNSYSKGAFVNISDNNNSLLIDQKNGGSHYASVVLSGGNKNVDITQQGSAGHMANVTLTGLPVDLSLTQSGSTQNYYSINFNCATAGGCAKITVTQGQ